MPASRRGAYRAVALHGDDEQKARLLPPLAQGTSTGTMCLTEAHAGTDLGLIRTRAEPDGDGPATASPARRSSSPPASTT